MSKSGIIVAQLGARMHYAVPRILYRVNCLEKLYTDICAVKGWPRFLQLMPEVWRTSSIKRLLGRVPQDIPPHLICAFTHFGYEYAIKRYQAKTATEKTSIHLWAGEYFNELIIKSNLPTASFIYGYNSASERLFSFAKSKGIGTILEQTIAPKSVEICMLNEEISYFQDRSKEIQDYSVEDWKLREQYEWNLADKILCASEFVYKHLILEGVPPEKCLIVPYGVDLSYFKSHRSSRNKSSINNSLRVLFIGQVNYRKGIFYLLEAMKKLEKFPVHCRIIGNINIALDLLSKYLPSNVELVGQVPRSEIINEYQKADVFCFPSLCEGSATVIYEALAMGLPVITTNNSGSIVRDKIEGFIVPTRDVDAIAESLNYFLSQPKRLEEMSYAALQRSQFGSLDAYSERLLNAIF